MSEYRDDRSAARLRIEMLEARIAEQEAELARRSAAISSRDEVIHRLHRGRERPHAYRADSAARASRALGLSIVTMTSLAVAAHLATPVQPAPHMWVLHTPALDQTEGTFYGGEVAGAREDAVARGAVLPPRFHADPPPQPPTWSTLRDPFEAESAPPRPTTEGPMPIERRIEPRVWGTSARPAK